MKPLTFLSILITMLSCNPATRQKADMIVTHAKVYTCDSAFTVCESFAVSDGRITATGTNEDILAAYTSDHILDAQGRTICPGFIDAHAHFTGYGLKLLTLADLTPAASFDDVLAILKQHARDNEQAWIQGRGWDQNKWPHKQFPDREALDKLFPDKPVYLTRIDGHAALVNGKALQLVGITAHTKVAGGDILLKNGEPTGILIDNAMELVRKHIPPAGKDIHAKALLAAQQNCFAVGLTTVCDAGLPYDDIVFIDSLQKENKLLMRIYAMLEPEEKNLSNIVEKGVYITDRLRAGAIKLYADGALGSRGACLLQAYSDAPDQNGLMVTPDDTLVRYCKLAYDKGFQVCTHAIGDAAVRTVLGIYARVLAGSNDRRWRIEHAQVVDEADFGKFGTYAIIPSIQATHATSDMYWAGERLGPERLKNAYAYRKLLQQNGWLCNGTDFPIEGISPLMSFYAAVARKDTKGYPAGGFQKENALSRREALLSMTLWAARALFEEANRGSLEPGKWADFVILSHDIMNIAEDSILKVSAEATFIGGKEVFQKKE